MWSGCVRACLLVPGLAHAHWINLAILKGREEVYFKAWKYWIWWLYDYGNLDMVTLRLKEWIHEAICNRTLIIPWLSARKFSGLRAYIRASMLFTIWLKPSPTPWFNNKFGSMSSVLKVSKRACCSLFASNYFRLNSGCLWVEILLFSLYFRSQNFLTGNASLQAAAWKCQSIFSDRITQTNNRILRLFVCVILWELLCFAPQNGLLHCCYRLRWRCLVEINYLSCV